MQYLAVFKRELKLLLKKPGMMIIAFVGPLFLTLFFGGVYYNDYVNDIPIAIIDEDGTSLSRTVTEQFVTNERFQVTHYPETRGEMKALIDGGEVHMGLWIPNGFEEGATSFEATEILLFTDGTNIVVGNNAYAQAATIIQTVAAGVEMKLIEAKGVEPQVAEKIALVYNISDRTLYDSKMTYMGYLIICFVAVFLQQLYMAGMGSTLIRHKQDLSEGNVFINAMATSAALIVSMVPATLICVWIIGSFFHVNMIGNLGVVALMTVLFLTALTGPALVFASITKDRVVYSQFSLMLSLPTFVTSGCVWPVEQMPDLMTIIIKMCWPLINYAKLIQEILIKGRAFASVQANILQIVVYGIVYITMGVILYKRAFSKEAQLKLESALK